MTALETTFSDLARALREAAAAPVPVAAEPRRDRAVAPDDAGQDSAGDLAEDA